MPVKSNDFEFHDEGEPDYSEDEMVMAIQATQHSPPETGYQELVITPANYKVLQILPVQSMMRIFFEFNPSEYEKTLAVRATKPLGNVSAATQERPKSCKPLQAPKKKYKASKRRGSADITGAGIDGHDGR